ncbi:uncharacterized protein EI97DRAFT_430297 [Westerdykella ornata]|uniref:Uncharacterized protein n=1 Tax=Westerdykella ornata TaxID=318751 RepID=A0A6A6JSW7_WESOR|nr:uncharacterized protein EI97DRAFT_430297 [Westerdykella ornata]KAF2279203.1 hypothetical protein EI97DRAFT_430297 [Westerdykella ornata]
MSYADVAKKGPHQSAEEARAPAMPEVERSDESVHSLVDVDSPHVSSVPSDFESQSIKTDTQAERIELEERARQQAAKEKEAKDKAKEKAKRGSDIAKQNAKNPVILGNALTLGILGTLLGIGAYRKYAANKLTWKLVGTWAGVVGLFALGDYYVSQ